MQLGVEVPTRLEVVAALDFVGGCPSVVELSTVGRGGRFMR